MSNLTLLEKYINRNEITIRMRLDDGKYKVVSKPAEMRDVIDRGKGRGSHVIVQSELVERMTDKLFDYCANEDELADKINTIIVAWFKEHGITLLKRPIELVGRNADGSLGSETTGALSYLFLHPMPKVDDQEELADFTATLGVE